MTQAPLKVNDWRRDALVWAALLAGLGLGFASAYAWFGGCLRYGIWGFAYCGYAGWTIASGFAVAALSCVALAYLLPQRSGRLLDRSLKVLGVAGGAVAAASALALPLGSPEFAWRVLDVSWLVIGLWLVGVTTREPPVARSVLGAILGLTLMLWGLWNFASDDPLPIIGGAFFAVPFGIWSWRFASRLANGWLPDAGMKRNSPLRRVLNDIIVALVSVFIVLPLWIFSTFGAPVVGDPVVPYSVRNDTDQTVQFESIRGRAESGQAIQPGRTLDTGSFPSRHDFAANIGGAEIWCRSYGTGDLKRMRFLIVIVMDPGSCR